MTTGTWPSDDCVMATALAPEAKGEEWTESIEIPIAEPKPARADWLLGLALLGLFLTLVVDDYPLRTLIAGN
jgi:hypothetical protein